MADPNKIKFRVLVPPYFNADQRRRVGNMVVGRVVERTRKENRDKDGIKFPKYSKSYTESLDFRIAGKSKRRVDLTLSGDMLDSLEVVQHGDGYVDIGYKPSSSEAGKAEGNVTGSYGRPVPNPLKARNFLGIDQKELDDIVNSVEFVTPTDLLVEQALEEEQVGTEGAISRILRRTLVNELE